MAGGRLVKFASCLAVAAGLSFISYGAADAAGGSGGSIEDSNAITPGDLRSLYFKRYPFAKETAGNESGQESDSGGNGNYTAYEEVKHKCKDDKINPQQGDDEHYHQNTEQGSVDLASATDKEVTKKGAGWIKTYGYPMSDTQFQIIDRECRQRLLELFFDPERFLWAQTMNAQLQTASLSNGVANAANTSFDTAFNAINDSLMNVANEFAGDGGSGFGKAINSVQQMYKRVFMPMALLFLVAGAVLTQVKGLISASFLDDGETTSPFDGIIRAVIAIFLIPATQLIVSYSIDIGNSLAYAVRDPGKQWIQTDAIIQWAEDQTYVAPATHAANTVSSAGGSGGGSSANSAPSGNSSNSGGSNGGGSSGGSGFGQFFGSFFSSFSTSSDSDSEQQGKAQATPEDQVVQEQQGFLDAAMQIAFNGAACLFGNCLTTLTLYQLVFMCYLFLLGPIAACFFAWPGVGKNLFRTIFSKWLDAVMMLSLWRFYWCVLLAVMSQRISFVHPDANSTWEMMVFASFLALLLYVPFQPFVFDPGKVAADLIDKAAQGASQAANGMSGSQGGAGGVGGAQGGGAGSAQGSQPAGGHSTQSAADQQFASINSGESQPSGGESSHTTAGGQGAGQSQTRQSVQGTVIGNRTAQRQPMAEQAPPPTASAAPVAPVSGQQVAESGTEPPPLSEDSGRGASQAPSQDADGTDPGHGLSTQFSRTEV